MKAPYIKKMVLLFVFSCNAYAVEDMSMQWVADDIQEVFNESRTFIADMIVTKPVRMFIDHKDGTVTDKATGLMWKKCSEGQTYQPEEFFNLQCGGSHEAHMLTWAQALDWVKQVNDAVAGESAGYHDWRLPNIKELDSLMMTSVGNPSLNGVVFPGKQVPDESGNEINYAFWSSSVAITWDFYKNDYQSGYGVWVSSIVNGYVFAEGKTGNNFIMLVRDPD